MLARVLLPVTQSELVLSLALVWRQPGSPHMQLVIGGL
jgi:hypothetical protein